MQATVVAATALLAAQVVIFVVLSDRSHRPMGPPEVAPQAQAAVPAQPAPAPPVVAQPQPAPPPAPAPVVEPTPAPAAQSPAPSPPAKPAEAEPPSPPPRSLAAGSSSGNGNGKRRVEPKPSPPKSKQPERKVAQVIERDRIEKERADQRAEQLRREEEQRRSAEQAERDRLDRERAERQKLELQIAQQRAEQERLEKEKLQAQLERQRAEQLRIERQHSDPLVMVVSARSGVGSLSSSQIQGIYLGHSLYWPNGTPVYLLNRPAASDAGRKFYSDVLQMSASRYREYWDSGPLGSSRPDAISDVGVLLGRVAATPGAVGYVLESELAGVDTRGVKVIRLR